MVFEGGGAARGSLPQREQGSGGFVFAPGKSDLDCSCFFIWRRVVIHGVFSKDRFLRFRGALVKQGDDLFFGNLLGLGDLFRLLAKCCRLGLL